MTLVELRVQGVLPKRQIILQIVDLGGRQNKCRFWCEPGGATRDVNHDVSLVHPR